MSEIDDSGKEMYRDEDAPSPEIPSWFEARLSAVGGTTLDGRPRLRVIWGQDAKGFPWPDNEHPKYISPNNALKGWSCFILEQYAGPEFFGDPGEWEKARFAWGEDGQRHEIMAPYPSRGEYVLVQPLCTPDGEPLPLTDAVADYVSALMKEHHSRPLNAYTSQKLIAERLDAINRAREEKRQEGAARLEIHYDESATRADATNARQTREWNKLPAAALSRAREFLSRKRKGATQTQ